MTDTNARKAITPADYQPELPLERLILREPPSEEEAVPMDVLFVGGGPAGLAGAIELARLVKEDGELGEVEIGVLEKAEGLGEHCVSGAIVELAPFRELFPDVSDEDFPFRRLAPRDRVYMLTKWGKLRIPTPPTMHNRGNYTASICELVKWMGEQAEALDVNVFSGFPAGSPFQVENVAPWDIGGTANNDTSLPYDTTQLSDGSHTITAAIQLSGGGTEVANATFLVVNDGLTYVAATGTRVIDGAVADWADVPVMTLPLR